MQTALDSRVVIEQAKGVLAARHDLPIDDAFQRLRTRARSQGRRLHEVAREIVEQRIDDAATDAGGGQASRTRRP